MLIKSISSTDKKNYDAVVDHPLQTIEWGTFREKAGVKVIRRGIFDKDKLVDGFQLTIHKIPKTSWTIGYLPKGEMPNKEIINALKQIGKEEKCLFIQVEPNVLLNDATHLNEEVKKLQLQPAAHPLFTKYTFILDLTKSEEDILKEMHSKARYNIKVAQKHGVEVVEDNSDKAFEDYLRLVRETTTRQGFFAHTESYHRKQWQTLPHSLSKNQLSSHLFVAKYKGQILTAWIAFVFKDMLYYPYGASSSEHREVMSSNLMMWEVIRYGKKLGLKQFDMWGATVPNPTRSDPWYGFHTFKEKYGAQHVEFVGSYDLVMNPLLYQGYKVADKLRWFLLKLRK